MMTVLMDSVAAIKTTLEAPDDPETLEYSFTKMIEGRLEQLPEGLVKGPRMPFALPSTISKTNDKHCQRFTEML